MPNLLRFLDRKLRMQQLRLIEGVAQTGSLSAAARQLGLTQPALTKGLREIEEIIGADLFERHNRGVDATPVGEVVIRFAARVLSEVHRLDDDLDHLDRPGHGLVVLGALPVAAAGLLPSLVERMQIQHPDLELRLVEGRVEAQLSKLKAGDVDMVLGRLYRPELPDGLYREALFDEPLSFIARAGHPIFSSPVNADAVARYDLILPTFSQRIGREIEHMLDTLGVNTSARTLRSTSHFLIREICHDSDRLAVCPRLLMAGDLRRGSLKVVPVGVRTQPRPSGLVLDRSRPLSPAAGLVLVQVRTLAAEFVLDSTAAITPLHGDVAKSDGRPGLPPGYSGSGHGGQHAGLGRRIATALCSSPTASSPV